jgi:hypothetical protein
VEKLAKTLKDKEKPVFSLPHFCGTFDAFFRQKGRLTNG